MKKESEIEKLARMVQAGFLEVFAKIEAVNESIRALTKRFDIFEHKTDKRIKTLEGN